MTTGVEEENGRERSERQFPVSYTESDANRAGTFMRAGFTLTECGSGGGI